MNRLLREDISQQGGVEEAWIAQRILRTHYDLIAAVALAITGSPDKLIAHVEVRAQLPKGACHDTLECCIHPTGAHAGWHIETELGGKRRELQGLLVKVVEGNGAQVAGFLGVVNRAWRDRQRSTQSQLQIPICPIQELERKGDPVGTLPIVLHLHAGLGRELPISNRIGVFKPQRAAFIEVVVVNGPDRVAISQARARSHTLQYLVMARYSVSDGGMVPQGLPLLGSVWTRRQAQRPSVHHDGVPCQPGLDTGRSAHPRVGDSYGDRYQEGSKYARASPPGWGTTLARRARRQCCRGACGGY